MDIIGDIVLNIVWNRYRKLNLKSRKLKSLGILLLSIIFIAALFAMGCMMS
ncbi:hypothetical protein H5999_00905 [[Clostridium] spiroforme]|nr:hypothetical protein [Thomasclavelia spiroformis]